MAQISNLTTIPVGPLGIIALPGTEELAKKINDYIVNRRRTEQSEHKDAIYFNGYERDTYLINAEFVRFDTGEGKCVIHESVRDFDIYILIDPFNYGVKYKAYGKEWPTLPDSHYANLKRAIGACAGKPKRITVIMPMLYEGRQHKRSSRESLDCAESLIELCHHLNVENIITFDAHDPRVQNAIPRKGFENVTTTYQMIKGIVNNVEDIKIDKEHLMIISPDEGGLQRCIYYSTVLGVNLGMFYKRRDYSKTVNGRNPIIAHEFLGTDVEGKDVIVVDDMISSGESILDVCKQLKERNAGRIFVFSAFGLFTKGLDVFDDAYSKGLFNKIFTTNLIYGTDDLKSREWYSRVEMSKYISMIIEYLNLDQSISSLLNPKDRIEKFLLAHGYSIPEDK